jgi:DNA primase
VSSSCEEEDPRAGERRRRRERLLELLERTCGYYERYLWEPRRRRGRANTSPGAGLEEAMLREFRVGYAPSAWDRVLLASRRGGFSEQELLDAGLVQRSREQPGRVYDRFRARITFPLCDAAAACSASARGRCAPTTPKYLNSADGEVYHKREHLFGLHLARAWPPRPARSCSARATPT